MELQRKRRGRGFTLIELLTVMTIVGILAAISTSNFLAGRERAGNASAMADVRSMATATLSASAVAPPTTIAELEAEGFRPGADSSVALCSIAGDLSGAVVLAARHQTGDTAQVYDGSTGALLTMDTDVVSAVQAQAGACASVDSR